MSRGVRDLIDSLGDRKRRSAAPGMAPRGERLPLDPGEDIAAVAQHLDIGAARFVATPRHGFDIDIADLPALLRSTAEHASERGVAAYIQLPGRCLPLTAGLVSERLDDIATRPRFRLLVTGPGSSIVENIAIESWKRSARAYRSLSDDNEVRLNIADLPEPSAGPARTEASFSEPIDVVYTWVDSRDPGWRAMARDYLDLDRS